MVLARFGVPEYTSTVIRQFHEEGSSMKACKLARVRMTVGTRNGLASLRGCDKDIVLPPFLYDVLFAAAIHAMLVPFSEDPDILRDLAHLEEGVGEDGVKVGPL